MDLVPLTWEIGLISPKIRHLKLLRAVSGGRCRPLTRTASLTASVDHYRQSPPDSRLRVFGRVFRRRDPVGLRVIMTRLSTTAAVAAVAATVVLDQTSAHMMQMFPISRQYSYGPVFKEW